MSQTTETTRTRYPAVVGPVLLIGLGVILLLQNLNLIQVDSWLLIARLWPLALILIGIEVIFGRRSAVGALLSGLAAIAVVGGAVLLMLFPGAPLVNRFIQPAELSEKHLEVPLEGLQTANVKIDWYIGRNTLYALPSSSTEAFVADLNTLGDVHFDARNVGTRLEVDLGRQPGLSIGFNWPRDVSWNVGLHPDLLYNLYLDGGAGSLDIDLGELLLNQLEIDQGAGAMRLSLPDGDYQVVIDGGAGAINLDLPAGAVVQIELDSGAGAFNPGSELRLVSGSQRGDGTWETENYSGASDAIRIRIDQGAGAINVRMHP